MWCPPSAGGSPPAARTLLQNTGAVLSIAFVLAVVTSSIPKSTLFAVFSGLAKGLSAEKLAPFISNMHVALWALSAVSLLGALVCLLRPSHDSHRGRGPGRRRRGRPRRGLPGSGGMSAHAAPTEAGVPEPTRGEQLRIGDVARLVGTTPRTIRYYEQMGLLPAPSSRVAGSHRTYSLEDVERLREIMRLKELLGLSLEELGALLAAEEARAAVRAQLARDDVDAARRRELLQEALGHIDRQLELVRRRAVELGKLEGELCETRKRVKRKLREQDPEREPPTPSTTERKDPRAK